MSTPGRTDMLMKPTRVTHQALLSDQDSISWSSLPTSALCRLRLCNSLHQWAKHQVLGLRASEREGFKGRVNERLWGRINTRNIEGRETQEFYGKRVKECSGFEGESKAKRFDGE